MGDLTGKKALVTAAAAGIGRATALAYAREGAKVIATDIAMDQLQDLADVDGISIERLDVLDKAAISSLVAAHPDIDILVICAGWVHHGNLESTDDSAWDRSFDINVKQAFHLMQAVAPNMLARGGGSIVAIASIASSLLGIKNRLAYGASKAGLIGLVKAVAAEFIRDNINCNALCPGTVYTPSLEQRIRDQGGDFEKVHAAFIDRQPMGRIGEPGEMADLAVYLGSDKAKFMTGQAICIDGGMTVM